MHGLPFRIADEDAADAHQIDQLCARAFGPGRFARTAYRLREGASPVADLCLTGWRGESLAGSIRFTAIKIGERSGALLLGPLTIAPEHAAQGLGRALMGEGIARAEGSGYRLVILVGDLSYYSRVGFVQTPPGQMTLPGPVDPARILARELTPGALANYAGRVLAIQPPDLLSP